MLDGIAGEVLSAMEETWRCSADIAADDDVPDEGPGNKCETDRALSGRKVKNYKWLHQKDNDWYCPSMQRQRIECGQNGDSDLSLIFQRLHALDVAAVQFGRMI